MIKSDPCEATYQIQEKVEQPLEELVHPEGILALERCGRCKRHPYPKRRRSLLREVENALIPTKGEEN